MAKKQKSKLLAMALCASVMTGIYASPVFAGAIQINPNNGGLAITINGTGNIQDGEPGIYLDRDGKVVTGYFTIENTQLATAMNGVDVTFGNVTANTISVGNDAFLVTEDGNVVAANVSTAAYDLNTVGTNTQKITYDGTNTVVDGKLVAEKFGNANNSFWVTENGAISAANNKFYVGTSGEVKAANGNFQIKNNGNVVLRDGATVDGVDVSELSTAAKDISDLEDKTKYQYIAAENTTGFKGALNVEGNIRSAYGGFVVGDGSTSLHKGVLSLGAEAGQKLTAEQLVNINNVIKADGNVVGTTVKTTSGADLDTVADKTAGISQHKWNTTYFEGAISATGSVSAGGVGENDQYQKLTANKLATINTVITDEGEVNSLGDVTSKDGTNTYSLNTVGANTQGIKYHDGVTTIGGNTLAVNEDGFVTINNGAFSVGPDGMATVGQNIQLDGELGTVTANDLRASNNVYSENYNLEGVGADLENLAGDFETTNANVAGIKRDDGTLPYGEGRTEIEGVVAVNGKDGRFYVLGEDGTQAAVITNDGTARFGFEDEKHVRLEDGTLKINDANKTTVASLSEDGLMLTDAESGEQTLTATKIADIEGITRDAETGTTTIEGATSFDTNGMNVGNGAVVANTDGSFSAANGAFDVAADGTLTISNANDPLGDKTEIGAGYITMGDTNINGFGIETPYIEAQSAEIGGVEIDGGLVDGVDVGDLDATVNGRLGGIERVDSDNDGDLDTTIIEDSLSANVSTVNMFGENGLDFTYGVVPNGEAGVNVTGNMHFASGSDVTFNYDGTKYDNKSYSLNDLVDGINDLNGRVDVLEDKTTGITYDEVTGSTTITDQVGTDGVQGNNSITVGNDGITMNGNTVVNGSNTAAGGDGTVPDTGDKDIAHTVNGDQLINGDQHVTGNSQFDGSATFGDTVGNQTVIDGGTITTGDTTINGAGMTVGTTNIAKDSVSADKGTFGEGTFGSGEDQTVINNDGVTVGGEDGTSIKHDEISVGDGGYIGGGDVVSGEGVSLNQTAERVGRLENKVGKLEDRIDKVGAMAAAIANLRTMGYDPAAPTEVAVGLGQYRDETGAALGLFHYPNRDFMLSLSVSTSGDEVMGGIGATWKFGRKSPEKVAEIKKAQAEADVRRAEAQKLAKAEELKAAAKEAKIKAQMERHAKLAAERAAEAEAK